MKQVSFLGLANPTGEPGKEKFHWLDGMVSRYDAWASGSGSVNMVAAKMHSNGQWYASKDTASFAYCSISGKTSPSISDKTPLSREPFLYQGITYKKGHYSL